MRLNSVHDVEEMGQKHGTKIAKLVYDKYGPDAAILGDLLYDADPGDLIEADPDYIIKAIGPMEPRQERILRSICNSIRKFVTNEFGNMDDEDDFADEYGDTPTTVFIVAFWNAFDDILNRLQLQ